VDLTAAGEDSRELSQPDFDAVFRPAQATITRCISEAVGDYPLDKGTIEVALRVERSGIVKRMRISAPQLLVRRGLVPCARAAVLALKFPPSGGASVVTYPFQLQ
jgi:hypothetical protein